jgi:cytochrome c-type biogenesis protein
MTRALGFSAGFVGVFVLLGVGASALGAVLVSHRVLFNLVGGFVLLLFGLRFLGVVQIPLFDRVFRLDDRKLDAGGRHGGLNAALMGVVFAFGWSPCAGPILASVLTFTASQTSDPLTGALYLGVYGAGIAAPLLVMSAMARPALRLLGRIKPWLPWFERALGVALIALALSMLYEPGRAAATPATAQACPVAALPGNATLWAFESAECPTCQAMKPVVARVAERCEQHRVQFISIDLASHENRALASQNRVVALPTYVVRDADGHEVARLVGQQSEQALVQALAAVTGESCSGVEPVPKTVAPQGTAAGQACPVDKADGAAACGGA